MLGGDNNAVSGSLKKAIGSRNIRLASPEIVVAVTRYEIGSIPPFHWQQPGLGLLWTPRSWRRGYWEWAQVFGHWR